MYYLNMETNKADHRTPRAIVCSLNKSDMLNQERAFFYQERAIKLAKDRLSKAAYSLSFRPFTSFDLRDALIQAKLAVAFLEDALKTT